MKLKEALEILAEHNYLVEADEWTPTKHDLDMINRGRTPRWAKNVKEVGKRNQRPVRASYYAEIAMDKVTNPYAARPTSEDDVRRGQANRAEAMKTAFSQIEASLPFEAKETYYEDGAGYFWIDDDVYFKVTFNGAGYDVKRFNGSTIFDRAFTSRPRTVKEVVQFMKTHLTRDEK